MSSVTIGLIGDYNEHVIAHRAIPRALELASEQLSSERGVYATSATDLSVRSDNADTPEVLSLKRREGRAPDTWQISPLWLGTETLARDGLGKLADCDGLWCVPASPYASMGGALSAIRYARENSVPFLGTCGGFQHALLEYAQNVLGLSDAVHAETSPDAAQPLISRLACTLVEKEGQIVLARDSRIATIFGRTETREKYHCSFGLNRAWHERFQNESLRFTGWDADGDVRVFEVEHHPFFFGTLFQPERSALRGQPHPLIIAFVRAAQELAT